MLVLTAMFDECFEIKTPAHKFRFKIQFNPKAKPGQDSIHICFDAPKEIKIDRVKDFERKIHK